MRFFVGVAGLEPATSSTRTKRATRLRHTPNDADYTLRQPRLQVAGLFRKPARDQYRPILTWYNQGPRCYGTRGLPREC